MPSKTNYQNSDQLTYETSLVSVWKCKRNE